MARMIRHIAQCYDSETGVIIEESVLKDEEVSKAQTLKELGYLHLEQIDFLQKIQDFKIKQQIILYTPEVCPNCGSKARKEGSFNSRFHAVLTDHAVRMQRMGCRCGWMSASSIEGLYGSSIHPDLLEKQALQGSNESYEKSSRSLNADSGMKRAINSHSQIYKTVKSVGELLEEIKSATDYGKENCVAKGVDELISNIDGGHIKSREEGRSFEAMVASVHRPESLVYVDKNHNKIESKSVVASAKDDRQETMKLLFKQACISQGMTSKTTVICLADGAENCRSIARSIEADCSNMVYILDWFHIGMKFKNIAIPDEHKDLYNKVKWHLWHGKPETALIRLEQLKEKISEDAQSEESKTLAKLDKLSIYISNNKEGIVDYSKRKQAGLVYTSNLAETNVNSLINERQKGKQKMLWTREGAHNILQIRAAISSKNWKKDWSAVTNKIYKQAVCK